MKNTFHFKDGTCESLYSEALDCSSVGEIVDIERWSAIEYDNDRRLWQVSLLMEDGRIVFEHPKRSACVAYEHELYNNMKKEMNYDDK